MPVADHTGTLADVDTARRTLSAKFEPQVVFYVAWAGVFALLCGSRSPLLPLVGAAALPAASVAATWWQARRARLIYPRRIRLFSCRAFVLASLLSLFGMVVVLAIAGALVAAFLHRGTWVGVIAHRGTAMSYLLPFVVFIVPTMAAIMLPWRIDPYGVDACPMRKVPDQPAALDPVIEPRQRITVCAMLAAVDSIEAGFLAKTLRLSDDELRRQTAELVAAHYINVHPHDGRWWFGFTAVGRSAYRRHLRALQRAGRVSNAQPPVAADEIPNQ
ncbi:transcriptional regulator [Mycobacterium sp.]|jgi:hypothetical protein|uniref:transcriptional regulator n=1 Tax=Mycobacterium sp. TaxID=1785 RepID=UPI002B598E92|nr:transcriptional regulator [Mycobacterium sp.]HXB87505.1 transcriptional regulator [Mycobacterium sp.]